MNTLILYKNRSTHTLSVAHCCRIPILLLSYVQTVMINQTTVQYYRVVIAL